MPQAQEGSTAPAPEIAPQPLRVLMPSPIGPLGVELQGSAVVRLVFEPAGDRLAAFTPLRRMHGSEVLDEIFGRLSEYFAGARRKLEIEIDLAASGTGGLTRRLLRETAKIPFGRTRTDLALAEAVGRPESAPEILSILQENPLPILVPCHRVLPQDGGLGSYIGGLERKRWLLEMESRPLQDDRGEPL